MRGIYAVLLFFLMLAACQQKKDPTLNKGANQTDTITELQIKPPDTIIGRATMIRLMVEAHLIESALVFQRNRGVDTKELNSQYYQTLFSKYKTSRRSYTQNLEYYQRDQEKFIEMYDEVIKSLEDMGPKKEKSKEKVKSKGKEEE